MAIRCQFTIFIHLLRIMLNITLLVRIVTRKDYTINKRRCIDTVLSDQSQQL